MRFKFLIAFFGFIAASAIGLYFRTYPLHDSSQPSNEVLAEKIAYEALKTQIASQLGAQARGMTEAQRDALASERTRDIITRTPARYQELIRTMLRKMAKRRLPSEQKHYLLESDPYYYYYLTRKVVETGSVSDRLRAGEYFDPFRRAPRGDWVEMTFHPHAGAIFYKAAKRWFPRVSVMQALCYFPLLVFVLSVAAFWIAASWGLGLKPVETFFGSLVLVMAPMYIERSAYGWYDTDPYNVLFPLLILATAGASLDGRGRVREWVLGGLGGALTALYSFFWVGWPLSLFLLAAALVPLGLLALFYPARAYFSRRYAAGFFAACVIALLSTRSGAGLGKLVGHAFSQLNDFMFAGPSLWPNIFITVSETWDATPGQLARGLGGAAVSLAALAGILFYPCAAFRRDRTAFCRSWTVFIWAAVLTVLSLRVYRFALLLVPLAALGASLAASLLRRALSRLPKPAAAAAVFVVLAPLAASPAAAAHRAGAHLPLLMNDAWYRAMTGIKESTEPQAVIAAWWPPGHFIKALGERGVIVDGATQHFPQSYWIARLFMTDDEKQAVGILRMLYTARNDAVDYLLSLQFSLDQAVGIVAEIVTLDRPEAEARLAEIFPPKPLEELLDKTHGPIPQPLYLFLHEENVEKNIAMTIMARWDFKKAAELARESGPVDLFEDPTARYVRTLREVTGRFSNFELPSPLEREKDGTMFFANGLSVNPERQILHLRSPEGKDIRPESLFYFKAEGLKELPMPGQVHPISALMLEEPGKLSALLADRALIRSMLFRLYYGEGRGLRYFKPVYRLPDDRTGTLFYLYAVDWSAYRADAEAERVRAAMAAAEAAAAQKAAKSAARSAS